MKILHFSCALDSIQRSRRSSLVVTQPSASHHLFSVQRTWTVYCSVRCYVSRPTLDTRSLSRHYKPQRITVIPHRPFHTRLCWRPVGSRNWHLHLQGSKTVRVSTMTHDDCLTARQYRKVNLSQLRYRKTDSAAKYGQRDIMHNTLR